MKWYGLKTLIKKDQYLNKLKKKKNFSNKKNTMWKKQEININPYFLFLYIPNNWNFYLIKTKNNNFIEKYIFYFYTKNYYFFLPLNFTFVSTHFNNLINLLSFSFIYKNNHLKLFWKNFIHLFYSFSKLFFKKIKFKGKGYYIYKNFRNTIALQFGYSHIKRLYFYFTFVKFLSKTSIILFGTNLKDISLLGKKLYSVRPINIFTGKGMRFTRQIIYRKTGKISSYR